MEDGSLIRDFAILIGTAGIAGFIFHFLRLPLLLGYILSGLIIGPHLFFANYIKNYEILHQFGDLGVIFLMFYIGLEFNLDKLRRTLGPSLLVVIFQTIVMMFVGILSAKFLHWSGLNGLFLGALMAISSTMMTIPVLREQNALDSHFAQLAIGVLVLEDFVAILLLIVLSGISMTGFFEWKAVWQVTFLVGVFVVMVFVLGRFFGARIAPLLQKMASPELLVLVAVGFALFLGEIADKLHFSAELGAFLAGSVLSQSVIAHKIDEVTESLRNIFCAVFFVTIGMLIDPAKIAEHWKAIVAISLVVTVAQIFVCWFGLFMAGEESKTSFYAAIYKAQIGEFSFVIAALGNSLGVTDPSLMTLAVGVSVFKIVLGSLLRKYIEPLFDLLTRFMPKSMANMGNFYRNFLCLAKMEIEKMTLLREAKGFLLRLVWYFFLVVGLMCLSSYLSSLVCDRKFSIITKREEIVSLIVVWAIAAFIIMPIFVGVVKNVDAVISLILEKIFTSIDYVGNRSNRSIQVIRHVVLSIVLLLFGIIFVSVSSNYIPTGYPLTVFVILSCLQGTFFWRELLKSNSHFERMFQATFIAEVQEKDDEYRNTVLQKAKERYPWSAQIKNFRLPKNSVCVGQKISELKIREKTETTVVAISRSGYTCYSPSPDAVLFPDDQLLLMGEAEQIERALGFFSEEVADGLRLAANRIEFSIDNYCITPASDFVGKTIAATGIRSRFGVNIAGIQRQGEKITTPKPSLTLEKDDILILTGPKQAIEKLKESELTAVS
ncbi:MAG: cation:proton antiporter [Puniceicoccales bacterium]|jgi:CPA2 family monovalent cation:H+ antiporter-2|nr:cation:proton antiporter [Puniceicoccales bacterium]